MSERFRLRAPELAAGDWFNTGGKKLSLAELRGKIVILDFWTFCCINCLHVLDELRELEAQFSDELVIVGVHSPKFDHEADPTAVASAVIRYGVDHPVLNDPDLTTWRQYAVRAWPTLAVIDPEGYLVAQHSGEGHAHALEVLLADLVQEHDRKGTLRRGDSPFIPELLPPTLLSFPAKSVVWQESLLIADAGNHRIVELDLAGEKLLRAFGTGARGRSDGLTAEFSEPNGLGLLPTEIAAQVGYDLVVADTVNHLLRGINLTSGEVRTIAGTGQQWMQGDGPRGANDALAQPLSSPWDVVWWPAIGEVVIAMAGIHQLWSFNPLTSEVRVLAGTTNEGLLDGRAERVWLAQTSGLAVDGDILWFADSETSSLRQLSASGLVTTAVGTGLFDFGFVDGDATTARLQHPLGVAVLADKSVAIADTYNGAIRRYDPTTDEVTTLAQGLSEPSGVMVRGEHLLVVESGAHRVVWMEVGAASSAAAGRAMRTQRPAAELAPGEVELEVIFTPPLGQKLDDRFGPSVQLSVSATPPELLLEGAGITQSLSRTLRIADLPEGGVLHVAARAASCDEGEFPACHVHQQDWGVPVQLRATGERVLKLPLAGLG